MASPKAALARWVRTRREGAARADDRPPGDIACRNCGAVAPGAYCPSCGQETRIALPGAVTFLRDAAGRYVAFDGRFWRTLVPLLLRPGFLTREYLAGRRRRYIRPARLVLVLALVLFAVARLSVPDELLDISDAGALPDDTPAAATSEATAPRDKPRVGAGAGNEARRSGVAISLDGESLGFSVAGVRVDIDDNLDVRLGSAGAANAAIAERVGRRLETFNRLERHEKVRQIVNGMLRYGPYALVALLPAFALLMQVLYPLRSARYPDRPRRYAEHLVYGAHNHAFVALVVTLVVVVPWPMVAGLLSVWPLVYLPLSMKRAYGGGVTGVLVRTFVVAVVYACLFAVAVAGLVLAAVVLR